MFRTPSARHRFFLLVAALALIHIGCFAVIYFPYAQHGYSDFTIFYTAGKIATTGQAANLYQPETQWNIQQQCCRVPIRQAPLLFNHAPYEALLFAPLALFPYGIAYTAWFMANLGILLLIGFFLREYLAALLPRWWLFPFAAIAWVPVFFALVQGQDSLMLALFYTLTFVCIKRGLPFLAGACIAFASAKPQLALPFMLIFALRRQWKIVLGFLACGAGLTLVSIALIGRTPTTDYLGFLVHFSRLPVDLSAAEPFRMPNLRGLILRAMDFGFARPAQTVVIAAASALVIWWAVRFKASVEEVFAMALGATLLASYHLYSHDLTLLLVAVILFTGRVQARRNVHLLVAVATIPWFLLVLVLYLTGQNLLSVYAISILAFCAALSVNATAERSGTRHVTAST